MGITYDDLDQRLAAIEARETSNLDPTLFNKVQHMITTSAHKRAMPPTCPLDRDQSLIRDS